MTDHPVKRGELIQSKTAEGWTVYDEKTDSLHLLNATAKAIWELCDGQTNPEEMAAAIAELTGADLDDIRGEVAQTLLRLSDLSLIS